MAYTNPWAPQPVYGGSTYVGQTGNGQTTINYGGQSSWNPTPVKTNTTNTGNVGSSSNNNSNNVSNNNQTSSGPSQSDLENRIRSEINSGYDNYFSQLDSILNNDLPSQKTAQEGIVQSQLKQGQNTLTSQKEQGLGDLATTRRQTEQKQATTLQELADNIKNQFKAGQIYLGARGAGDSSAANQYSYAISKMGSKARGNVLNQTSEIQNQINDREFKLKNVYDTEINNIKETANQKLLEIANWFSQAQQQLKTLKAQGQLQKGQDLASLSKSLLSQAMQQMSIAQQEAANKRNALDTWAMNNSKTIGELKTNLASVSNYSAPSVNNPGVSGAISVDSAGNMTGPVSRYWSTSQTDENKV